MDAVPRPSGQLRRRRAVRQILDAAVLQIQAVRQILAVLRDLPVLLDHQGPSACVSGAWDEVHRQTAPALPARLVRPAGVADSCQVRSWDGDRRLVCRAEFLLPVQGCPCPVQLEVEWGPYKQVADRSVASPSVERVARADPLAWEQPVVQWSPLTQLQ